MQKFSEKRVVGIRGLDLQIYNQIQELARLKNDNVANIINDALKKYLQNTDDVEYTAPKTISGQSKFEVTAEALKQLTPLRIEDVNTVIILDDEKEITTEMIDKDLESISRVEKIYVPNRLYYIILRKAKNIVDIQKYQEPWKEEVTLNFGANAKINRTMLEKFKQENKRLKIIVSGGDLLIENDISDALFEELINELKVRGNLVVPEDLYASVLTKGTIEGSVQLIDKEGKPVDQIQFGNVGSKGDSKSSKRDKKGSTPFTFSFNPGMDTLMESMDELKEGLSKIFQNINLDEEVSDAINSELKKEFKKNKRRVTPTKVKSSKRKKDEDDNENEDEDDDYKIDIE